MALGIAAFACSGMSRDEAAPVGAEAPTAAPVSAAGIYRMANTSSTSPVVDGHNVKCTAPHLQYGGGQVIANVEIVQVSWGPSVNASVVARMEDWYSKIVGSPHLSWLSEYDTPGGTQQHIGLGTLIKNPATNGVYTITPANTASTVSDGAVGRELTAQLAANNLPQPTKDATGNTNTIYMIDFPPGVTIMLGSSGSCAQFCAYHSSVDYNANGFSGPIYYGVHPDMTAGSGCAPTLNDAGQPIWHCGGSTDLLVASEVVHSHELIEAVTDPQNNSAWIDFGASCGEIGDICANQLPRPGVSASVGSLNIGGGTYYVQTEWSNAKNDCIVSYDPAAVDAGAGDSGAHDSGVGTDSGAHDSGGGGADSGAHDSGVGTDSGGGGSDSGGGGSDSGGGGSDGGGGGSDGGGGGGAHDSGGGAHDGGGGADSGDNGGVGSGGGCAVSSGARGSSGLGAAGVFGLLLGLGLIGRRRSRK